MPQPANSNRLFKIVSVTLFFAVAVLLVWGGYQIISIFIDFFSKLDRTVAVAVVAASATVMTSVLTVVLGRYFEVRLARETAHRERKIPLYDEFLGKLFSVFADNDSEENELGNLVPFLRDVHRKLVLWSGPEVVKAYADWQTTLRVQAGSPTAQVMIKMINFFLALRSDLGHSNKGITPDHLVGLMLRNPELFMAMYRENPDVSLAELVVREKKMNTIL